MTITLTKIAESHRLNCPGCNNAVLIAHPDREEVPGHSWITEGSCSAKVDQQLSQTQKQLTAHDHTLMFGTCHSCGYVYYVVTLGFSQSHSEASVEYLMSYKDPVAQKNFVCQAESASQDLADSWLTQQIETPFGPVYQNYFGPYQTDDKSRQAFTSHACLGVDQSAPCWVHGAEIIMRHWDDLQLLAMSKSAIQ